MRNRIAAFSIGFAIGLMLIGVVAQQQDIRRSGTGGGGSGGGSFSDITGSPTDNTALAGALASKQGTNTAFLLSSTNSFAQGLAAAWQDDITTATNSAVAMATNSAKSYTDAHVTAGALTNDTATTAGQLVKFTGTDKVSTAPASSADIQGALGQVYQATNAVLTHYQGTDTNVLLAAIGGAPLTSPALTGTPTINSQSIETQLTNKVSKAGDTMTGTLSFSGTATLFNNPSLTTAQKNAASAQAGSQVYDSDIGRAQVYDGAAWHSRVRLDGDTNATSAFQFGALQLNTSLSLSNDVFLIRDAANTLALRNGVNVQTLNLYETYTDNSNWSRSQITYSSGFFQILTDKAGTGFYRDLLISAKSLVFFTGGTSGANPVRRWNMDANGHFLAQTDNTYDIGASGATRPRTAYIGTSVVTPALTVATSAIVLSKTITAGGTTGDQTINKASGSVNFAGTAQTITVTDSLVDANSVITASVSTDDTTAKSVIAVPGSGSFVLKLNAAATAETKVSFQITN